MMDRSEVRTYIISECVSFRITNTEFGGLSNMAPGFPLLVNGIPIRTSEALYQACRFPDKPEIQRLIIKENSPMTAKMKGKPYRKETRKDWTRIRVNVMRWCLKVKLAQNWQKFGTLLLATGNRPIVENSRNDDFWGAKPDGNGRLIGRNVLGRLLMELREELRNSNNDHLKRVSPPNISQFLLLGKPIGVVTADLHSDKQHGFIWQPKAEKQAVSAAGLSYQNPGLSSEKVLMSNQISLPNGRGTMIPKECKRLAEIDFPIAAVGKYSLAEKAKRMGTPHQLHLWWAWRPLAACRAMTLGLLLPDPCDPLCPDNFKKRAQILLERLHYVGAGEKDLRNSLMKFIGAFANWDASYDATFLEIARGLVSAAYPEEAPLVVDPFAGGGSIPLEALRVGGEAFAGDLNPVACLILKAKLEHLATNRLNLPKKLAEVGDSVANAARKALASFYPSDPDGSHPIAYIWARTVRCESPNCGAEIPLIRSFWLCNKVSRRRALRYEVHRSKDQPPAVEFQVFEPKSEREVPSGTVSRAKATCPCCGAVLGPERVCAQLAEQRGGADVVFDGAGKRVAGARMLAVVTLRPGQAGRNYRLSVGRDYEAIWEAQKRVRSILDEWERKGKQGINPIPDEPLPPIGTLGFRVQRYGMLHWGDLFTTRQKLALVTLTEFAKELGTDETRELLALSLSKCAERNNSICDWMVGVECPGHLYSQQVVPPAWDFAEANTVGSASGSFQLSVENTSTNAQTCHTGSTRKGDVHILDATHLLLPDESCALFFTDPPYYDAVPYSDLSDFFFVWLKRALPQHPLLRDPFDPKNPLTPKVREAVQDEVREFEGHPKDRAFFEETMGKAFAEGRRVLKEDGIGCVVFAHKTTEGWEALLSGLVNGGWVVTGSWPITTERSARMRARDSAALATSVHLICRPRAVNALVGDWGEVIGELPKRVGDWMERLQTEGIRGADLVFACIGPALEIFSRYRKVEAADGREVKLDEYLQKVWEVVGRTALEQILGTAEARARNSAAGALEEDSRLTALFLWTLQSTSSDSVDNSKPTADSDNETDEDEGEEAVTRAKTKGYSLVYDVVRRFAQPLGIALPRWEGRIIETDKGVVRLLSIAERAKQLFGEEGASSAADWLERDSENKLQLVLFPEMEEAQIPKIHGGKKGRIVSASEPELKKDQEATTLDRVHAAMLLQASGKANALRALIKAEQERSQDFLRLANALSALYPSGTQEKRLVEAMLLAVPK